MNALYQALRWTWTGGYNIVSGPLPDLAYIGFFIGGYHELRHRNCHIRGCWRIKTAIDPEHNWPACKKHHSLGHLTGASS